MEHCDRCGCRGSHVGCNQRKHWPTLPLKKQVRPLQQSALVVQNPLAPLQHIPFVHEVRQHCLGVQVPPDGTHIGVVEVVLVDVEVVGVVVEVLVEVVLVDVEVVLVDVLVVLLVDVLVEVVLVVLVVVGAAVVVVVGLSHEPRVSPWRWWLSTARWETSMVFSSGVPGLWQMITFCC